MTHARIRHFETALRLVQWGFAAGSIWLLTMTSFFGDPLPRPRVEAFAGAAAADPPDPAGAGVADLKAIWERDLRQELIPPKPKVRPKPEPPPPPPPVRLPRLLATFVEKGQSWSLFVDAAGNQRVRTAGERIDDFDIVEILPGTCVLLRGKGRYEVSVPLPAEGGAHGVRRSRRR